MNRQMGWVVVATIVSAAAYFFGTGLHPHWYLLWFAPLPVLILGARLRLCSAFLVAFFAYAFGSLNMWNYYRAVLPLGVSLFVLTGPAALFGLTVIAFRALALRGWLFKAAFSVPLVWVAFQYLQEFRSVHSTFGNVAYTQMDFLPVLQIASITGIWGVDFLLLLFPAAIAVLFLPGAIAQKRNVAMAAGCILILALGFGVWRVHKVVDSPRVTVGLIATDVDQTLFPRGAATLELVKQYAAHIPELVRQGAQVVVLPEKIGRLADTDLPQADAILEAVAREQRITISVTYERALHLNETRLYSTTGALEATYEKHHMLPAFEPHLVPGTERVVVERPSGKWGLEICKDMDFPLLSRQYASGGAGLMLVPAWDFVADGWLHGRMAILRGVEDGFSIARAAKQGTLTITDDRGRVLAERDTASAPFATLVASVPVWNERTIYDRAGDWFAWLDLALTALLFASLPFRRRFVSTPA